MPAKNELKFTDSIDISVTFNIDMDPATFNGSTFVINAMSTGLHAGTITYDTPTKSAARRRFLVGIVRRKADW